MTQQTEKRTTNTEGIKVVGWNPDNDPLLEYREDALRAANVWISEQIGARFAYEPEDPITSFLPNGDFQNWQLQENESNRDKVTYKGKFLEVTVDIIPFYDYDGNLVGHTFKIKRKSILGDPGIELKIRLDLSKTGHFESQPEYDIRGCWDVCVSKAAPKGRKIPKSQHFAYKY